jgi:hypothetical protein
MLEPTVSQIQETATFKNAAAGQYGRLFVRSGVMQVLCTKLLRWMNVNRWGNTDLLLCNV